MGWHRGEPILFRDDQPIRWLAVWKEDEMATNGNELWVPRCYKCGGTLVLAPANQYTKFIVAKTEIYCTGCQWRGTLEDNIKKVYVRT